MRATTGNPPSGNLWQFFIARHDDISVYPISPSTLLRKSVPPPPLPPALHKRERTLSAVIMFSLFTGLYTGSVGGNQEGRYYATPSATSKLDLPRVPHGEKKKSTFRTRLPPGPCLSTGYLCRSYAGRVSSRRSRFGLIS